MLQNLSPKSNTLDITLQRIAPTLPPSYLHFPSSFPPSRLPFRLPQPQPAYTPPAYPSPFSNTLRTFALSIPSSHFTPAYPWNHEGQGSVNFSARPSGTTPHLVYTHARIHTYIRTHVCMSSIYRIRAAPYRTVPYRTVP